jgi:hypothetical protein
MRRLHLSIAWGVVVALSLWIAGQIGLTRDSVLTPLFLFVIPAAATAAFVMLWRRADKAWKTRSFTQASQYRPSTLHSRHRMR